MELHEKQLIIRMGVESPFWRLLVSELEEGKIRAIKELTEVPAIADNLGLIARLQERISLTETLQRKPYDLLGAPVPR